MSVGRGLTTKKNTTPLPSLFPTALKRKLVEENRNNKLNHVIRTVFFFFFFLTSSRISTFCQPHRVILGGRANREQENELRKHMNKKQRRQAKREQKGTE